MNLKKSWDKMLSEGSQIRHYTLNDSIFMIFKEQVKVMCSGIVQKEVASEGCGLGLSGQEEPFWDCQNVLFAE